MRTFKDGDKVTVVMTGLFFDFQVHPSFIAHAIHIPEMPGDMLYLRVGELDVTLNPQCHAFVGLISEEREPWNFTISPNPKEKAEP
jgi:hypothetical protein